jgi:hypothetical protein
VDSGLDSVVNRFNLPFAPDNLSQMSDVAPSETLPPSGYLDWEYIKASSISTSDADRLTRSQTSVSLYGVKEMNESLDLYGSGSTAPARVMEYYFDRYGQKQRKITIRVPRVRYYSFDIFDVFFISHQLLYGPLGYSEEIPWRESNYEFTWYHEGVRMTWDALGGISGEVVAIAEKGEYMDITIETKGWRNG